MYGINDWDSLKDQQRAMDRTLNVRFYWGTEEDGEATLKQGRKIEKPLEMCHIRIPGDRQSDIHCRAHAEWRRFGEETVTYAMRFEDQYKRFRASEAQMATGTPLAEAPFLNGGEQSILKALDIHTVEQLAALSGQALKNVGPGGMGWQQAAEKFIQATHDGAAVTNLVRENAELKAAMAGLNTAVDPRAKYAETPDGELRELIKEKTGAPVRGNPSRATMIRMLVEADRGVMPAEAQAA